MKKKSHQTGLFVKEERLERLSKLKDPLVSIGTKVDFEQFRTALETATVRESALGGRPPYDRVMLFKALVLKKLYGLSDDQLEYQINDRLSFMRFLGLDMGQPIPDSKTLWLFGETLHRRNVINQAF